MQRKTLSKILNIYLYQTETSDSKQFKLRTIETQKVEESPEVSDEIVLSLLSGCEKTFALCLNDALDNLNSTVFPDDGYPPMFHFNNLCDSYTREIITDASNPGQRYSYHEMDWLLYTECKDNNSFPRGDIGEFTEVLSTVDEALNEFRKSAENDAYQVAIHYCDTVPDFNDKLSIIHTAFAAPVSVPEVTLSRHILSWLVSALRRDNAAVESKEDAHQEDIVNITDDYLAAMLKAEEPSLRPIIEREVYHYTAPALPEVSSNPLTLFASDLRAAIKPMHDEDALLSVNRAKA